MAGKIKQWITIKGRHIPIYEGESKEDVARRLKEGFKQGKENRPSTKEHVAKKRKEFDDASAKEKRAYERREKTRYADSNLHASDIAVHRNAMNEASKKSKEFQKAANKKQIESTKFNGKSSSNKPNHKSMDNLYGEAYNVAKKKLAKEYGTDDDYKIEKRAVKEGRRFDDNGREKSVPRPRDVDMKKYNGHDVNVKALKEVKAKKLGFADAKSMESYEKEIGFSWQDKDEETKAKQIVNAEKQKAERNGWKAPSKNKLNYDSVMYEDKKGNLGKRGKKYTDAEIENHFKKFGFGENGDDNWDEWVKDTQLKETINMAPRTVKSKDGNKRFWQGNEKVNVRKDGMGKLEKTGKYNPDKMGFDTVQSKSERIFDFAADMGMDPSLTPKELMRGIQKKFKLTPKQAKMAMINVLGWEEEDLR